MPALINITNQPYGRWTVLQRGRTDPKSGIYWICECTCGTIREVRGADLRNNVSTSCGCYQKEVVSKLRTIHGESDTKFYQAWCDLRKRCNSETGVNLKYYHGKIFVCERWNDPLNGYLNFRQDMLNEFLIHYSMNNGDTELDRVDNTKDYEPGNCRWITHKENLENRSINRWMEATYVIPGLSYGYTERTKNRADFARKYGLIPSAIYKCIKGIMKVHKGWTFRYV